MAVTIGVDSVCFTHTFRSGGLDLAGFLDKTAAYGAAAVQIDPLWPSQGLDLSEASLARLGAMLSERSLALVVKGNSAGKGSLALPPSQAQAELDFFRLKIEAAARLGARVLRLVARAYPYPTAHTHPPQGIPRRDVIAWVIENLKALLPAAEELCVSLVVENHGDLRIAELERILAEVHSPWLGVQFDLLEQVAIFEDPGLAAERLLPYAFTVHWSDARPKLSDSGFCVIACPPGEGIIDLDGGFRKITSLVRDVFIFSAFQAESEENEDFLVKAYLDDLHNRFNHIRSNQ